MRGGTQWTPAQTGKQGLFRLVMQAQESYSAEVLSGQKSYKRYVLDFIHSKQYHDETDAWSKNEHLKNYYTIVDLLSDHEKLVCKYFSQEVFNETSIASLLDEFYVLEWSQAPQSKIIPGSKTTTKDPTSDTLIDPLLDKETIDLIVQLANEVNLFREKLDADYMVARYETDTLQPVVSNNNTRLVLLLDKLASHGIISYNWRSVIAKKKLIVSSSGKKYLNQHDLSSTLNRIKDMQSGASKKWLLTVIDGYIKRIKNKEIQ